MTRHSVSSRSMARKLMAVLARQSGLIAVADWMRYLWVRARNASANRAFRQVYPQFATPPPSLAYDAYSTVDWHFYSRIGETIARKLGRLMAAHAERRVTHYLEWGSGPGCVIRHMPEVLGEGAQVFGSDYNPQSIAWCRQALPGITFVDNQLAPPLPFADGQFDCVCGLSVLTHLSGPMCRAWLQELARVVNDGGLIILTTKGDSHAYRLMPGEQNLVAQGRGVFRGGAREGKRMYDTILPARYLESLLPESLAVIHHDPDGMPEYQQDLWLLRKLPVGSRPGAAPSPVEGEVARAH